MSKEIDQKKIKDSLMIKKSKISSKIAGFQGRDSNTELNQDIPDEVLGDLIDPRVSSQIRQPKISLNTKRSSSMFRIPSKFQDDRETKNTSPNLSFGVLGTSSQLVITRKSHANKLVKVAQNPTSISQLGHQQASSAVRDSFDQFINS